MPERVYNFYPGPATLPLEVLEQVQDELVNFKNSGMSILETSHRSQTVENIVEETETLMKELLGADDKFRVLFLQGGASTQFAMVPMNFLNKTKTADYILTGRWSDKAVKEAELYGKVHIAASSKESNYKYIPGEEEINTSSNPEYIHITTNNTVAGTQWKHIPDFGKVPVVADMSSDILSRSIDINKFGLIYAGAQKNLGPAGVTVVVINKDFMERAEKGLPTMLSYATHANKNSLYNTPPVFSIYVVNLVLKWIKEQGGVKQIENRNELKAKYIYDVIDKSGGFYKGHARKDSRSFMNITFTMDNEDLEHEFIREAEANGFIGLKGHRSVGGLRASVYNAMPVEGCKALADFMEEFQRQMG